MSLGYSGIASGFINVWPDHFRDTTNIKASITYLGTIPMLLGAALAKALIEELKWMMRF